MTVNSSTGMFLRGLLYDRRTGRTTWATDRISYGARGAGPTGVSAGARFILTYSEYQLYRHDLRSGRVRRIGHAFMGAGNSVLSGDGRHVASPAVMIGPRPSRLDIYVWNAPRFRPRLVSVGLGGRRANGHSSEPDLSRHGRFVAFESEASNLVRRDHNGRPDVFVRDRREGRTYLISVGRGGRRANGASHAPSISPDGRFVAFVSKASNLVPGDTNGKRDVFLYDCRTRTMTIVTSGHSNGGSGLPAVSASGKHVAFVSRASNLVARDTNRVTDVFVTDLPS